MQGNSYKTIHSRFNLYVAPTGYWHEHQQNKKGYFLHTVLCGIERHGQANSMAAILFDYHENTRRNHLDTYFVCRYEYL